MSRHIRLGLIQMSCSRDRDTSFATASRLLEQAAEQGVQIAIMPELFASDYFCQTEDTALFDIAEPIPGPTTELLAACAARHKLVIVGSVFERRTAGIYHNTSMVFDEQGGMSELYRKMHIPDDPLFLEKYYFTPGDTGFKAHQTSHARLGTLICWDQWYPEAARLTALQGAEILCYPTAIGWHPAEKAEYGEAQAGMWETIQRSHAIANGCFVAAVNRIGHEGAADGGIEFWGSSFVADPYGRVLAKGSVDREEVVIAEVDLGLIERTRQNWPFFRDRRIDAYQGLLNRFGR
ncbi:MAG: carbon-nitrogen hydrolase [Gammaproteobacteria bacterium]|nr:carbon-nitrogen hydrolase [Pseudomonadales bacterium]MCP5345304.1 carbon-nitrogen hydrolase [Pseudomonadales bacterium]